jgi:LmbE family N-acetylglucosaminyl deacetylase
MKTALVLGGHLDDSVIAVGGIIKKLTDSKIQVSVTCFGNGDEATEKKSQTPEEIKRVFGAEAVEAHKVLGVTDFKCHDLPDFGIQESRENYRVCIGEIRRVKPEIIFGHYWAEYFQHRAMARMTSDAWWQAGWLCSADLGAPWAAKAFYHFEVVNDLPEVTHIVDVTDTFDAKIESWKKFKTAEKHLDKMVDQLTARARFHGSKIGVKYAEVLKKSAFVPENISSALELIK